MQHLRRNIIIVILTLLAAVLLTTPISEKIRFGKDLAGGVSLIYGVAVKPGESDVISRVIDVVKERLDPTGVLEINVLRQGNDRIEVTMPLPSPEVKALRAAFDKKLTELAAAAISADDFDRISALPVDQREAQIAALGIADTTRLDKLRDALAKFDAARQARDDFNSNNKLVKDLQTFIDSAKTNGSSDAEENIAQWTLARDTAKSRSADLAKTAAQAAITADGARQNAIDRQLDPREIARALALSDKPLVLKGQQLPSPRKTALDEIRSSFPGIEPRLQPVLDAWAAYEAKRKTLDDPDDIKRILRGSGVLNFRIAVQPGEFSGESQAREQLRIAGPRSVRIDDVKWFKINKIQNWIDSVEDLEALKSNESVPGYFAGRFRLVAERYKGEYYVLLYDKHGMRLTEKDGNWSVTSSPSTDQVGRPAIGFEMDPFGGQLLGDLTGPNINKPMAVLLDDEIYTAPNLNDRITRSGQISGNFTSEELKYIIRVLSAGSLKAKLSNEPLSQTILAPSLGADNLDRGLQSGVISFIVVGGFMILYYFFFGFVAVVALAANALLLIGAMAFFHTAFTLPGIAGVVLTFGMAVDANVLIYERVREELNRGHDLRTALRLGYERALSAIVDGNITTLIVCVVLGFTGTQEIKGFGLTLGIGTVTTLFAQLFITRTIFTLCIDKFRVRQLSMLPLAIPAIERALHPKIDWMKLRFVTLFISLFLTGMGAYFIITEQRDLLGIDFRGGTAVTIVLKDQQDADGKPHKTLMTRAEVESRLDDLRALSRGTGVEVVVINPDETGIKSNTFRIKSIFTDPAAVSDTVARAFTGLIDSRQPLRFTGSDIDAYRSAPIFPITSPNLGDSIDLPGNRTSVEDFYGGAAIVLNNLNPVVPSVEIENRLRQLRNKPDYKDILRREVKIVVLEGTPEHARSAAILVRDPSVSYFDSRDRWLSEISGPEWNLIRNALTQTTTLSTVESFSASVASSFQESAILAVLLSTVLVVIYVWVRFGSFRYSAAAIITTLHDCFVAVGMVAISETIYIKFPSLAAALGILPFKIDLPLVAAILTILGYSLNDTIIVMDRIRELRGKLPYASRAIVNNAINQTVSRTIITSGTTLLSVIVLYIYGGEGLREFSYVMLCGILVGTYSSIAVAAPLVWIRKADPHADEAPAAALPA